LELNKRHYLRIITIILAFAALLSVPFYVAPYYIGIMVVLFVYITLAESYDIVGGYMGYANLGHAVFFGFGVYSFAILYEKVGLGPYLSFILGVFPVVIFAALIGYPMFRLKGFYFSVAMLGLLLLMQMVATNLKDLTGGYSGMSITPEVDIGVHYASSFYLSLGVALATIFINYKTANSKFGVGLAAIREDEEVAEVFGIDTMKYKRQALILSALFAGLAGEANMWFVTIVHPRSAFGLEIALTPIVMAMLGGAGTTLGPVIGAIILRLIEETLLPIVPYFHLTVFGASLIIVGLFMPGGIAGSRKVRSALHKFAWR